MADTLTKRVWKTAYPGISPQRPEVSQAGKTILVTGGSTGIGFAISRAFAMAGAARIIVLGRRVEVLKKSVATLAGEYSKTVIEGRVCNVADLSEAENLWSSLAEDGIFVDVLVLNAATPSRPKPIIESTIDEVWGDFVMNVRSILDFTKRFYGQQGERHKSLVNVSSSAIHYWEDQAPNMPGYGLTKNSGTLLLQQIAKDTSPDVLQIVSFHPGWVLTDMARAGGVNEESDVAWDHEDLAGHFAVWASSEEARFLSGRFVWAKWDVDELKSGELRDKIENDPYFLRVGVVGL